MKAIATMIFGIASAVGTCVAGAGIASYVVAQPEHGSLRKDLKPDLWTIEPTRVIQSRQHYERLPPSLSTYAQQELQSGSSRANTSIGLPQKPLLQPQAIASTSIALHQEWCRTKFRSYDAATDSYRSFGGDRRPCVSPTAEEPPVAFTAVEPDSDLARSCAGRYVSYRRSDNTYQPYRGERVPCVRLGVNDRQVADAF